MNEPDLILNMLGGPDREPRTIAVVGLSDDPTRPSHSVSAYMQRHGYRIIPVNPAVSHVLGERAYPGLCDVPDTPDIVNVFRLPRYIPGIVDEMIDCGLQNLWVQLGIRNEPAAIKAEDAGIHVVMDRCILIEHQRLFSSTARVA
jgi:uncharacterized protein